MPQIESSPAPSPSATWPASALSCTWMQALGAHGSTPVDQFAVPAATVRRTIGNPPTLPGLSGTAAVELNGLAEQDVRAGVDPAS